MTRFSDPVVAVIKIDLICIYDTGKGFVLLNKAARKDPSPRAASGLRPRSHSFVQVDGNGTKDQIT
jgi:hypothetical protein